MRNFWNISLYQGKEATGVLLALSSLELGLFPELAVFMFAHFLFTPFFNVSHSSTLLLHYKSVIRRIRETGAFLLRFSVSPSHRPGLLNVFAWSMNASS